MVRERAPLRIALGGFMATGKSTVGPALAAVLRCPFVDLDAEVSRNEGRSIPEVFASVGEAGFRLAERAALERVAAGPAGVVALGGGTLHQPWSAALLADFKVVVLTAPWATIAARLVGDTGRPLAADSRALFEARAAGYASAGPMVDTADLSVADIVAVVLGLVGP